MIERSIAAGVLEPLMRRCIELFGANRIAWGSNYPTSAGPLTRLVEFAQTELAFLSETDARRSSTAPHARSIRASIARSRPEDADIKSLALAAVIALTAFAQPALADDKLLIAGGSTATGFFEVIENTAQLGGFYKEEP